jgi:hypothetical protein
MSNLVQAARLGGTLLGWAGPMTLSTGTILVGALAADRLLERRVAASMRLGLYLVVLARLALPAGWVSPLGLLGGRGGTSLAGSAVDLGAATVVQAGAAPLSHGAAAALLVYLAVVLLLMVRWGLARITLARRLRGTHPLGRAIDGVPVERHPSLGPLVAGLMRPRIIVPAALADGADAEALAWVLRHERAHVRRRDLPLGALVQVSCILVWPVLPVWIAAARIRALMELACDEQAVRGADGPARRRYGELLMAMATQPLARPLGPMLSFGSPLKGRLRALATRRRWPLALQGLAVAAIGVLALACAADNEQPAPEASAPIAGAPVVPKSPRGPVGQLARRTTAAAPNANKADVVGNLDKQVIRNVIANHINEVKDCYETELVRHPTLSGRVFVKFTVGTDGQVTESGIGDSTLRSPAVETCIVNAVAGWRFPKPENGVVTVSYPFVLTSGSTAPR